MSLKKYQIIFYKIKLGNLLFFIILFVIYESVSSNFWRRMHDLAKPVKPKRIDIKY